MRVLAALAQGFNAYGGIAQSSQDFLRAIVRCYPGSKVEAFTRSSDTNCAHAEEGIFQHAPSKERLKFAIEIFRSAILNQYDLIYCGHLFLAPLIQPIARLKGIPFYIHLHGLELTASTTAPRRMALRAADRLISVSRDTARMAADCSGVSQGNIVLLPNRVRDFFCLPKSRAEARSLFDLDSQPVLLTVGRIDSKQRHKGHERIIAAMPSLLEKFPDILYLIAGAGDDLERLRKIAEAHEVVDRVKFLGRVSDEILPLLYGAADLYAMPSTGDGFGIAFVEAMACGTPALGLAIGGTVDALCPGELGHACASESFEMELEVCLSQALRLDASGRSRLSVSVRNKFGQAAFDSKVRALLDPLANRLTDNS